MKKRLWAFVTAAVTVLSFAGCSSGSREMAMEGVFNAAADRLPGSSGQSNNYFVFESENYAGMIENDFILTAENNVSTFSADVDTASYAYFRKLVSSGYSTQELIAYAGSSIRTEEMINYFSYEYTSPSENELFGVTTKIAPCPWNSDAVLMCMGLQAEVKKPTVGNNLVFLVDVSGSMQSDDKLPLLQKSFSYLVSQLTREDRISIVTYSGEEKVVLEGCVGSKGNKIIKKINSLTADGSTNGEAGLKKAYEIAKENYIEGGNNRIILASDGDLNVGISSAQELNDFISEKRSEGVYLSVLGFGTGNYNDNTMETIADNGNGVYYYIDGEEEAEKIFGDDLISTLYTVAEDVKMQLTFNEENVSSYRLVGYENRMLNEEDFEDDSKDAGEVGAGHCVTVCYELLLTEGARERTSEWVKLAVRYKKPGETASELNEYTLNAEKYTDNPDDDFKFVCAVIQTSLILQESKYAKELSLDSIERQLNSIDLRNDKYRVQFHSLIRTLLHGK